MADHLVPTDLAVAWIVKLAGRTVGSMRPAELKSIQWMIYNRCAEGHLTRYGKPGTGGALWSLEEIQRKMLADMSCLWPRNVRE